MTSIANRIFTGLGVMVLVLAGAVSLVHAFDVREARMTDLAPPAEDALTQSLDLQRITGFRYVNDALVEVTDDAGHWFAMKFTAPCPAFKSAKDFSLVTESYRNMDRFTAVSVAGQIRTFKDFAFEH